MCQSASSWWAASQMASGDAVGSERALLAEGAAHGERYRADAVGGEGRVDALHEVAQAGLLDPQRGGLVPGFVGGHAAGGGDPTPGRHERTCRLDRGQQGRDAQADVVEQLGRGEVERMLLPEGAGVEVQPVDPAESRGQAVDRDRRRVGVRDVGDDVADVGAERAELGGQGAQRRLLVSDQPHVVPLARGAAGQRPAHARAGSDDDEHRFAHDSPSYGAPRNRR